MSFDFGKCWFLTGPTAGGKTATGVALARRLGAEIISMDSMALFRGMDIGVAKPTAQQRAAAPHHLIDILEPCDDYSLAQYLEAAAEAASDILARSKQVLFVGGTPLYLKGLLRGIFAGPPADWELRRELLAVAEREGADSLHRRLAAVDPRSADRLHPQDARRIVRALEVFEKTGRSLCELQRQFDRARPAEELRVFVLDWDREALAERIDRRVEEMFQAGLADEVGRLLASDLPLGRTASQAIGYREVIEHLAGRLDLESTIALVKTRTRQFAKRQRTWFRSLSECRFVAATETLGAEELAEMIARQGENSLPRLPLTPERTSGRTEGGF